MNIEIPSGIPNQSNYVSAVSSDLFAEMEAFSREFLAAHPVVQATYGWVDDPLHQWSRQWEYPFVYQRVLGELKKRTGAAVDILDAGSGATFFPFMLERELEEGTITCCDYDASLEPIFENVNEGRGSAVAFRQADLRGLPFDDASFDIIYCVSVLEHTDKYEEIVDEFHRVLKSGGVLVATFDIGLDGVSDISPEAAARLNNCIEIRFGDSDVPSGPLEVAADSVMSVNIGAENSELLPWRFPFLSWLKAVWKRKKLPTRIGKNLAVLCAQYTKT
jgi:SAM-dependent methyltransferase